MLVVAHAQNDRKEILSLEERQGALLEQLRHCEEHLSTVEAVEARANKECQEELYEAKVDLLLALILI